MFNQNLNNKKLLFYYLKTNFKKDEKDNEAFNDDDLDSKKELSREEFEEFISKSGARGSYMVYRSNHKDEELGIDEI